VPREPEEPDDPDDPDDPDEPLMPPLEPELPDEPLIPPLDPELPDLLLSESDELLPDPELPLCEAFLSRLRSVSFAIPSPCDEELPEAERPDEPLPDEPEVFWSRSAMCYPPVPCGRPPKPARSALRALRTCQMFAHNKCHLRIAHMASSHTHEGAPTPPLPAPVALSTLPTMRLPPPLAAGARVALLAPAGPLRGPDELTNAIAHAESLGWEAVPSLHVLRRDGYLAGSDAERVLDLNAALQDDRIDGIWCVRGGYGAMRLLADVDYDAMRRRPKALIGYSDITALHAAFAVRSGVVTYHGPTARAELTGFARESLARATIAQVDSCGAAPDVRMLREGRAAGRLVGGNLALLAALAGTPYAPDYVGAILVIEDVGEPTYRIDRMLRQLALTGDLAGVAGIAFGQFTEGSPIDDAASRALDVVLREAADLAGVPAMAGIPLGHIDDQWTIPLGVRAELDADRGELHVLVD
jgi:muramoyltetrapeptide carboxypeptidase